MRKQRYRSPRRRRQPRSKRTRLLSTLAFYGVLILFLVVGAVVVLRLAGYRAARNEYAVYRARDIESTVVAEAVETRQAEFAVEAVELESSDAPTARPYYSNRIAALRKDNRDTVGWLDVLGTGIQYPVVQSSNNDYYMTRTFQKKKNASGAIFVDCWNAPGFTDFNTVIYGHNMKDGSMFAGLREYEQQKYADLHSTIEITLLNKKLRYRVFAAYISQGEANADFRGQGCTVETKRAEFIKAARKRSVITSEQSVSRNDRLLTLVTCTSGTHPWYWVVHAVMVEEQL